MKNPTILICSICTLVCSIIFIDGVVNFSMLPTYQFIIRVSGLVMAFAGLLMAFVSAKKQ